MKMKLLVMLLCFGGLMVGCGGSDSKEHTAPLIADDSVDGPPMPDVDQTNPLPKEVVRSMWEED